MLCEHAICPARVQTHAHTKTRTHAQSLMHSDAHIDNAVVSSAAFTDACPTDLPEYGVGNRRRKDAMIEDRYDPYMVRMARVRMTMIYSVHSGENGTRMDDHDPYTSRNGMRTDRHHPYMSECHAYRSPSSVPCDTRMDDCDPCKVAMARVYKTMIRAR